MLSMVHPSSREEKSSATESKANAILKTNQPRIFLTCGVIAILSQDQTEIYLFDLNSKWLSSLSRENKKKEKVYQSRLRVVDNKIFTSFDIGDDQINFWDAKKQKLVGFVRIPSIDRLNYYVAFSQQAIFLQARVVIRELEPQEKFFLYYEKLWYEIQIKKTWLKFLRNKNFSYANTRFLANRYFIIASADNVDNNFILIFDFKEKTYQKIKFSSAAHIQYVNKLSFISLHHENGAGKVCLWDVTTAQCIASFHSRNYIGHVSIAKDGTLLTYDSARNFCRWRPDDFTNYAFLNNVPVDVRFFDLDILNVLDKNQIQLIKNNQSILHGKPLQNAYAFGKLKSFIKDFTPLVSPLLDIVLGYTDTDFRISRQDQQFFYENFKKTALPYDVTVNQIKLIKNLNKKLNAENKLKAEKILLNFFKNYENNIYVLSLLLMASAILGNEVIYEEIVKKFFLEIDKLNPEKKTERAWLLGRALLAANHIQDVRVVTIEAEIKRLLNENCFDVCSAFAYSYLASVRKSNYFNYSEKMVSLSSALTKQLNAMKNEDPNKRNFSSSVLWSWIMCLYAASEANNRKDYHFILQQIKRVTKQSSVSGALETLAHHDHSARALSLVLHSAATVGDKKLYQELKKIFFTCLETAKKDENRQVEVITAELTQTLAEERFNAHPAQEFKPTKDAKSFCYKTCYEAMDLSM